MFAGRETAFNRPTSGSTAWDTWYSYKAVDGRYVPYDLEGNDALSVTCFAGLGEPWWQVDLGHAVDIQDVYYFGRDNKTIRKYIHIMCYVTLLVTFDLYKVKLSYLPYIRIRSDNIKTKYITVLYSCSVK